MNDIILDVRISKYQEPVRMIAIYDRQNGRLTIERALPYNLPKDPYKNKTAEQIEQLKANERYTLRVVDDPNIYKWDLRFQGSLPYRQLRKEVKGKLIKQREFTAI